MANVSTTDFFERVYALVRQVPEGRVTTYGAIARYLGTARSARMVGWAMNVAHTAYPPVPAHRVVNRNGLLTGKMHFGHPDLMQKMLEGEGISVENDKIMAFDDLFWQNWH
ncbi:MAG: MGMT family protein [Chitinophagales bacterium]|nr:MGMT family protein [Chitinophagales bacterium]